METATPARIGRIALIALPSALLLVFQPAGLASFAPPKALALCLLAAVASVGALWPDGWTRSERRGDQHGSGGGGGSTPTPPATTPAGVPALLLWAWLALAGALVLSLAASVDPWRSLRGTFPRYESLAVLLCAAALSWLIPALLDRGGLARVFEATFVATAVVGAYSLVQTAGLDPLNLVPGGRAWGTIGNPVQLGTVTAMLFPLPLAVTLTGRGTGLMRRAAPIAAALSLAACAASQTRGAWLGLAAGAAVGALSARPYVRRPRALAVLAVLAVGLVTVAAVPRTRTTLVTRLASIRPDSPSAAPRLLKWDVGLGMLRERPLTGWGWDTVPEVYPARLPSNWLARDPEGTVTDRLHAEWLDIAVATGGVGLAAVIALLAVGLAAGAGALRGGGTGRVLAAGLVGGVGAYVISSFTGFPAVASWPLLWSTVGLLVAIGRLAREGPADATTSDHLEPRGAPRAAAPPTLVRSAAALTAVIGLVGAAWAAQDIARDRALFVAAMAPGERQAHAWGQAAARYDRDAYVQLRASNGLIALGRAAGSAPLLEEAERVARRAVTLRPGDPASRATLADAVLAQGLRGRSGRLADATPLYEAALQLAPLRPDILKNAGLALYARQTTATVTRAMGYWTTAAEVAPDDPDAAFDLALGHDFLGRRAEALHWALKASSLAPDREDIRALLKELETDR